MTAHESLLPPCTPSASCHFGVTGPPESDSFMSVKWNGRLVVEAQSFCLYVSSVATAYVQSRFRSGTVNDDLAGGPSARRSIPISTFPSAVV